ncbi:hypothetical protein ACE38W_14945 [Chitinophaga sp. Hz27]|uniref:hypothetical protein n=1 Tax=Chitinophaga sp. Hz27 TaxID=3347169 RepID=UPI0035E30D5F
MKKINISSVSDSVGMPVKAGTITHLQSAYQEAVAALGSSIAGSGYDSTKVYILTGCQNIGTGINYNISAGSVFYNGEVYLVDATNFTIVSPNNAAISIVPSASTTTGLTYFSDPTADPVQFTDGIQRNVHEIRKCVIQPGLSGGGIADYNNWIDVNRRIQGAIGQIVMWKWPTGDPISKYWDISSGSGIHPYTIGWQLCNGKNGTIDMSGCMPVQFDPGQPEFSIPYVSRGGEKTHTLSISELPIFTPKASNSDADLHIVTRKTNAHSGLGLNNVSDGYESEIATLAPIGGGAAHNNMPPYIASAYAQRIS